ncbi:MAG: phosphoenolpyruvate hydrolase family protein, partial [Lachnospiraceae bacterium]|nr:phosphoenolpyruvate hydrolase family protein [Lachnospiraceae bacterium]
MKRQELLERLRTVIRINGHILTVATGNGMSSRYAITGGADLLLAMNAGRFRQMGQSAFSPFFGYVNCNEMVMTYGSREILPVVGDFPVIFGMCMQDPGIGLYDYLRKTDEVGFSGVINYPPYCLMDGRFRDALEQNGFGFEREIEGIRLAHFLDIFTVAYVTDMKEALQMSEAGADVICIHFGILGGGLLGASSMMSLESALKHADEIFTALERVNPDAIRLICGGPVQTPIDAQLFYRN